MKIWGLVFIFLLMTSELLAGSISIPLKDKEFSKKPATDLIYQNNRIDAYEAFELLRSGVNLSNLNPYESHLWQNTKHAATAIEVNGSEFNFNEYKRSPREFFRSVLTNSIGERFVMTASLENHTNIIRAALLRKLGYKIQIPKFYKTITVNFKTTKEKDNFLEKVGEQTLTKRSRWNIKNNNDLQLTLKDITLEPAKLTNVNIALPVMTKARQEERRVFRALLPIYVLTDFSQSINSIGWKIGRTFNNYLSFSHPYANKFQDTSIQDIKWIYKRITKLTRNDIRQTVALAGYPNDLTTLVLEKLLSSINSLGQHLEEKQVFPVRRDLTFGNIYKGKIKSDLYSDYVVEFFKKDADSPYEFNELFRLFRTQATYSALSTAIENAVDKLVPGIHIEDAALDIQEQISDFRESNPSSDGSLPLKIFSYPTANINTSVRRNVVFGNHMGNVAPIQLVDSVNADVNLGIYSMITGLNTEVLPSVSAAVGLSRTYSHVKAMPDLETATSQTLKSTLIPKLLKSLGAILKTEFECSLTNTVNIEESTINNNKIIYIKYDENIDGAKAEAIKKRAELITAGEDEDIILLVPINKELACKNEIDGKKNKSLEDFLNEFALNETFIISDSIKLMGASNATIPISTSLDQQLSISMSGEISKGFIKAVNIRKKEDFFEISIQRQNNWSKSFGLGLNYFIEIIKGTRKWLNGDQETLVYKVPIVDLEDDQKTKVLRTIRELFVSNSTHLLDEYYDPIVLNHEVSSYIKTLKILWYKSASVYMDHFIDITLPQSKYPNLSIEERKKSLFSTSSIKRNGKDYMGFFNSILKKFSQFLSLGQNSADPGQSLKGTSKSRYYVSEADVSNSQNNITTKIDYVWKGWSSNFPELNQTFTFIENLYGKTQVNYSIDRNIFKNKGLLKGYEIKSTLIVYPDFINKFKAEVLHTSDNKAKAFLKQLYGKRKWDKYCKTRKRIRRRFRDSNLRRKKNCAPRAARNLLKIKNNGLPIDPVQRVRKYNQILVTLLEGFTRQDVIKWIGPENFFASTRVTGFLEGSENGHVDYISNTYGDYNTDYSTGIFDRISSLLGITPYELRALNYTPGM